MRRSVRAGLIVVAVSGVALTACGGDDGGSDGTGTPSTADVVVHGDDALRFDKPSYTATAGSIEIELVNDGSTEHTLLIDKVSSFTKLDVKKKGSTDKGTAKLDPGTYTIYCDIPGHRGAGMEAKLIVS